MVVAIAWIVYASSIILHESGHVVAGFPVGGLPTLISTTDVPVDWSGVSAAGMTINGLGGSLVNVMLAALSGVFLTLLWFRVVSRFTPFILAGVPTEHRVARVQQLVLTSWISGGVLGVSAALLGPHGALWSVPIAVGATMGTTWPMLPAAQAGARSAVESTSQATASIRRSAGWVLGGLVTAFIFVFGFGPGIHLSVDPQPTARAHAIYLDGRIVEEEGD